MRLAILVLVLSSMAHATIALVSHTDCIDNGIGYCTTAAINDTGANLIVIGVASYPDTPPTITDSNGNTYNRLTEYGPIPFMGSSIYYCYSPTVTASDTFTVSSLHFGSVFVASFSGALAGVHVLDFEIGNGSDGTVVLSWVPGGITAATTGELFVTMWVINSNTITGQSINDGFTITDAISTSTTNFPSGMAYLVTSATTPISPTWTATGTADRASAAMATFHQTATPAHKPGSGTGWW